MTTRKRSSALLVIALGVALGILPAAAQEVKPASEPGDGPRSVEVTFAGFEYTLFADEPVQACVNARTDSPAGVSLTYRLFVREPDGSFSSVGVYPSPAIGALAGAQYGDCTTLEAVSDAS